MKNKKEQKLSIELLDKKLRAYNVLHEKEIPDTGWIHAIRTTLGMSLRQMGKRLSITPQSMKETEQREKEGSITLRNLREAGKALGLQLVYGFIPQKGSLEKMIEEKAQAVAKEIVSRASHSMMLEGQENSKERIDEAIKERAEEIKNEMPGHLWE